MRRHELWLILGLTLAVGCVPEQDSDPIIVPEQQESERDTGVTSDRSGPDASADTAVDTESSWEDTAGDTSADVGTPDTRDARGSDGTDTTESCPPNTHREEGTCRCDDGYVSSDDQPGCVRECVEDSDCGSGQICSDHQCVASSCGSSSCGPGLQCDANGDCVLDPSTGPSGSPPSCNNVPDWRCSGSNCGELIQFDPAKNNARWDYPINGETAGNQYRSWARRDLVNLIDYAAAKTACQSRGWSLGNGEPLGLGDMSEQNGAIPGTSTGNPGHPQGTHTDGFDIDLAYYQVGTSDNRLRPVCAHTRNGQRQYHCVDSPDTLDIWRTALFLAHLHVSPQLRVIGVDGKVGPLVKSAIQKLCRDGWVQTSACRQPRIAYEVQDNGRGWFRFHHHHAHVSLTTRRNAGLDNLVGPPTPPANSCLTGDCRSLPPADRDPRRQLY